LASGVEQGAEFAGAAGVADEFDPRAGAVERRAAGAHELREHLPGERGLDGIQRKLELLLAPLGLPPAREHGLRPDLREVIDGKPRGELVLRIVLWRVDRGVEDERSAFNGRDS
jgi:hypothetical protein